MQSDEYYYSCLLLHLIWVSLFNLVPKQICFTLFLLNFFVLINEAPKIIQNRLLMSHSSWTKASNSAWNWSQCEELQSLNWDQGTIKGSHCLNAHSFIESQWSLITKETEMFYFLFFAILSINLPPLHTHPHTHTLTHTWSYLHW